MNPFDAWDSTMKLIVTGICAAIVIAVAVVLFSLFGSRAKLKTIQDGDKRIAAGNKIANKEAAKRDNARTAYHTAVASQAAATAKELENDKDFDADARAAYFRVWDDALRGTERRSGKAP